MTAETGAFGAPFRVDGTHNLRDVGGYPAADGRQSAHGVLFRSDALDRLSPAGRETLRSLGLHRIVDLRSDPEITGEPSALGDLDIDTVCVSVLRAAAPSAQPGRRHTLARLYELMVERRGDQLVTALRAILSSSGPTLVHCTAGKDRTGVLVALALDAVGVEREAVVADYAASERNLAGEWASTMLARVGAGWELPEDSIREIVTTSPAVTMEGLLGHVDQSYGSTTGYLRAQGMTDVELAALRDRLTVTAD